MACRHIGLAAVLAAVLSASVWAQDVSKDPAPNELPTHLIKVLRTTNKAQINRYVPKVYDLKNVNPFSVWRWVNRSARIEEGAYFFYAKAPEGTDEITSGKVVITVPEYMLEGIDELMKLVDRAGLTSTAGETFFYFRPKHRHVEDTGFTDLVEAFSVVSQGNNLADVEANCFLVYDAPSGIEDLQRWLPIIDVPPSQVMIEVTAYEVFTDNESKLGLDYVAWKNGPGRNLFAVGLFGESSEVFDSSDMSGDVFRTGTGSTFGLPGHDFGNRGENFAFFLDVPSAFFDFLVVKGKAQVMTSARLTTRNLVPASLVSGDTLLYYETRVGGAPIAGVRPTGVIIDPNGDVSAFPDNRTVVGTQVSRVLTGETAGIELEITPLIASDEIDLKIDVSLVSHTGFDDQGVPALAERRVSSDLLLRDGEEVVLGGYSREVYVERADKIPVLGSLPFIGYLFGGDTHTTERRQIVLVLRANVIRDFSGMDVDGTVIDAALIRSKALREAQVDVPKTPAGFDQWLLDNES